MQTKLSRKWSRSVVVSHGVYCRYVNVEDNISSRRDECSEVNFKESEEIIIDKEILLSFGICSLVRVQKESNS